MNNHILNILRILRQIPEHLIGAHIYGYPSQIIQIIPEKKLKEAWFSYQSTLKLIFNEYKVDLILDIGANLGQSVNIIRRLYKGPIISFEPVASSFAALRNITPNDKNWFKFNYALGNKSGEQYINIYETSKMNSFLKRKEETTGRFSAKASHPVKELVQIRRLDDIVDEMPFNLRSRKIFLKTDTQGYDLEVFKGARTIWDNIVVIQAEVYHTDVYDKVLPWTENIKEYTKAGFKLAGLYPAVRDGLYYEESDCLMVR
jgi:FkbM family methyltransferase